MTTIRSITSWNDCKRELDALPKDSHVFRGHRDPKWRLESQLERLPSTRAFIESFPNPSTRPDISTAYVNGAYEANVISFLARFCEHEPMVTESKSKCDGDLWALGRHYGLITPLLDWTRNWHVAAFFAFADWVEHVHRFAEGIDPDCAEIHRREELNPEVCIWALNTESWGFNDKELQLIEKQPGLELFNKRQSAQEGVFTQIMTGKHFDIVEFLRSRNECSRLTAYRIRATGSCAATALRELNTRINYVNLFPDSEGAAKHANFMERFDTDGLTDKLKRVSEFRKRNESRN